MNSSALTDSTETLNRVVQQLLSSHPEHAQTPLVATTLIAAQTVLLELNEQMARGVGIEVAAERILHASPKWSRLLHSQA